jgi:ribosomal-protein-serine acetyltransferase
MTWCGEEEYSAKQARAFIQASQAGWKKAEQYDFAIIAVKDGILVGSVSLNRRCQIHDHANVGYWVRKSLAGKGIATAAVKLVADFGLKDLGLNRLEILVPEGNEGSKRVAEKAGAKREAVLRQRLVLAGICQDAALYSLVKADGAGFRAKKAKSGK